MFWSTNEYLILAAGIVVFTLLLESGYRVGYWRSKVRHDTGVQHVDTVQNAMLGLLALLLGFTFAMSVSRYDVRKELVLEEVNAIGTTSLRFDFLDEPARQTADDLLLRYVRARLDFFDAGLDPDQLRHAESDASRLQASLWALATDALRATPDSEALALLVESLNDVFDIREKRSTALDNHVPETVLLLLFVLASLSLATIGYACGLRGVRHLGINILFAILLTLVLVTILDLDRPRRGLIQVSQKSMMMLHDSLLAAREDSVRTSTSR